MKTNFLIYTKYLLLVTTLFCKAFLFSQAPAISWQKSLGGSDWDTGGSIQQTSEGGYIITGFTDSNDGDITGNHGNRDVWVVKLDSMGNITWQKCLGGTGDDGAYSIQQTSDGGYILVGWSSSNDGDVTGNHGSFDVWVVKLDIIGNITWQKSFGGSNADAAHSIQQTSDGGYIIAGLSNSNNGDVTGNHGNGDIWVVKLDSMGNIIWQKCLGGSSYDDVNSIQQTADGGYILAGMTESNNGDVTGNHGDLDAWVVKLDINGHTTWQKCLGGSYGEATSSIQQTSDGGYIIAGLSNSNNGDVTGNHGIEEAWVAKLDINANISWQKCLGGSNNEGAYSIQQTSDGGYILTGLSNSLDGDVTGNQGDFDVWVVRLGSNGNISWQKSVGGSGADYGYSIQQTFDGGYILTGFSNSLDGDVTGNYGSYDAWVVKLSSNPVDIHASTLKETISLYPNPSKGDILLEGIAEESYPLDISVTDVLGKEVYRQEYQNPSHTINLHIEAPSGTYYLSIQSQKGTANKKFVVE